MKKILMFFILFSIVYSLPPFVRQSYTTRLKNISRPNLVRLFYLNESIGTNVQDYSDFYDNVSAISVTFASQGQPWGGNGMYFDGINDNIDLNSTGLFSNEYTNLRQGTVLCWFRPVNTDGVNGRIWSCWTPNSDRIQIVQPSTAGRLQLQTVRGGTTVSMNNDGGYTLDSWNFSVVRWDTNFTYFLVNQKEVTNTTVAGIITTALYQAKIGSDRNSSLWWNGFIGLWAAWDRALSDTEIGYLTKP